MARGIMKSLRLEGGIMDALNRLKQQERTVLEEQERAEEYFEAAKEAVERARKTKEQANVQAEKNLRLILDRRRSLEIATNAEEIVDIGSLLAPLELECVDDAQNDPGMLPSRATKQSQSGYAGKTDNRVIRNRKCVGKTTSTKKGARAVQTSRMFAWNDLPSLKTREKIGSASPPSLKSVLSADDQNDFEDWVSVENAIEKHGIARSVSKSRSASLLSEIAVYRPGTPTQIEEIRGQDRSTSDDPAVVNEGCRPSDGQVSPQLLETQPDGTGTKDDQGTTPARKQAPRSIEDGTSERSRSQSIGASTWATSEGTGLFVSSRRRPRVVLAEGTIIGIGARDSLPTPESQSPHAGARKTQRLKGRRKRSDQGVTRSQARPPPSTPTPQPKKKRKVEAIKASSRHQLTSTGKQKKRPIN